MSTVVEFDVRDYEGWLHKVANSLASPTDPRHDDIVQEGRVAMWRSLESFNPDLGALPPWVTTAAKFRMRDVARGRAFLGNTTGALRQAPTLSLDMLEQSEPNFFESFEAEHMALPDHADAVVDAYHATGVLGEVLDTLTPEQRRYVVLRFWGGIEPSSAKERREVARDLLDGKEVDHGIWHRQVRPRLRRALSDGFGD